MRWTRDKLTSVESLSRNAFETYLKRVGADKFPLPTEYHSDVGHVVLGKVGGQDKEPLVVLFVPCIMRKRNKLRIVKEIAQLEGEY